MTTIEKNCYYYCDPKLMPWAAEFIIYVFSVEPVIDGYKLSRQIWSPDNYYTAKGIVVYTKNNFPLKILFALPEKEALLKIAEWRL